jgi:DNA phosphorothioation-associated putative methyltransferase
MSRTGLSRPVARALDDGLLPLGRSVFDYGCGRGGDIERLRALGLDVRGWDPAYAPHAERRPADVVVLSYVVNVIADPTERREVLRSAWVLARRALVVAARPEWEGRSLAGRPHGDGWVTGKGTFQKFFSQDELRSWIDSTLSVRSVAAAPGVFYVFRDERDAQGFRATQVRRTAAPRVRVSEALFEAHKQQLEGLCAFMDDRGRLPDPTELPEGPALVEVFGSVRAAFRVVRRVIGDERWTLARSAAETNLRVYLALAAFGRRPRMSDLPDDLQRDVKALFGSYKAAVAEADRLLFAVGRQQEIDAAITASPVGKRLPDAFYVHVSALAELPPVLRVYEGCAKVLVGTIAEATIVKLQRIDRKVAYLLYPDFDRDPHPALAFSLRADLRTFHVKYRNFRESENPPILHRKETFVPDYYPGRDKFARLSAQEERAGLLNSPGIGTQRGWEELLKAAGQRLAGHRLVRG